MSNLEELFQRARNVQPLRSTERIASLVRASGPAAPTGMIAWTLSHPLSIAATVALVSLAAATMVILLERNPMPMNNSPVKIPSSISTLSTPAVQHEAGLGLNIIKDRTITPAHHVGTVIAGDPIPSTATVLDERTELYVEPLSAIIHEEILRPIDVNANFSPSTSPELLFATTPTRIALQEIGKDTTRIEPSGIRLFTEGGPVYAMLRGGFHNVFDQSNNNAPQNFGAATGGWGMHLALGIEAPVASWLRAYASVRYIRFSSTYVGTSDIVLESIGPPSTTAVGQSQYTAALTLDEITLEPALRMMPLKLPLFLDLGLSMGLLVRQSGVYSTTISHLPQGVWLNIPTMPAPMQTSHIGQARTQCDLRVGFGAEIPVSSSLILEPQIRARYGFVPLFADNYPSVLAITPMLGLRYDIH